MMIMMIYHIKTQTLVIATNDFVDQRQDHLDIKKNDLLIVISWKYSEKDWVYMVIFMITIYPSL